jgi:hypothetical protein
VAHLKGINELKNWDKYNVPLMKLATWTHANIVKAFWQLWVELYKKMVASLLGDLTA